jgi:hypothetical protein
VYPHAPHPHAALLFIDLMIGPEGPKSFSGKYGYRQPAQAACSSRTAEAGFAILD